MQNQKQYEKKRSDHLTNSWVTIYTLRVNQNKMNDQLIIKNLRLEHVFFNLYRQTYMELYYFEQQLM